MVRDILTAASGAVEDKLYPEDAFVSYVRTGTGADVTVTTNIDMTKGYMVWTKGRSGATDHAIYDSARGVKKDLVSNSTDAQTTQITGLKAVSTTGHTIGSLAKMNTSGATYVDWVFRKATKFFDVVTYTGDGVDGRTIASSLNLGSGFIGAVFVKRLDAASDWKASFRGGQGGQNPWLALNLTTGDSAAAWVGGNIIPLVNGFSVHSHSGDISAVNASSGTYVAYLFAHDTSADGIIQCGSYVGNGSATGPTVTLGWEPQYVMVKNASAVGDWTITDSMRGMTVGADGDYRVSANTSSAETGGAGNTWIDPTATGFNITNSGSYFNTSGQTYIYMAIRRPNKVPTSGSEVFAIDTMNSDGNTAFPAYKSNFVVDMAMDRNITNVTSLNRMYSRLTGNNMMYTSETAVEGAMTEAKFDSNVGWSTYASVLSNFYSWMFKRAKGFFDNFCWTGTGVNRTIAHNLGVAPELLILKSRSAAGDWQVWFSGLASNEKLVLNSTAAKVIDATLLNGTLPTSTLISLGTQAAVNANSSTYVGYAFASLAGVQKIGTYVGNGTTQNLSFGFSGGARFFLCKAVTTTGSYWVFDSVRGIVASTDFGLQLNSTAAEVTSADCVDPFVGGISVVEEATCHLNTNGVTYMYWAIA